jgi:hypothetical protein
MLMSCGPSAANAEFVADGSLSAEVGPRSPRREWTRSGHSRAPALDDLNLIVERQGVVSRPIGDERKTAPSEAILPNHSRSKSLKLSFETRRLRISSKPCAQTLPSRNGLSAASYDKRPRT